MNSFGRVTGVAPGKATITATCGSVVATTTLRCLPCSRIRPPAQAALLRQQRTVDRPRTPSYVVLKPGATRTITAKATPASASQSFTFKSGNSSIATVSPTGVVTAVGTGSTSITISNGKATAMVTVIVNRSADAASGSDSSNDGTNTPDDSTAIPLTLWCRPFSDSTEDQVVFAQSEVPTMTGEILNALRTDRQDPVRGGRWLHPERFR
ncbi:MAG: Ig-like domain-containing protein [Faecalibacterium prausnitzii]